MTGISKFVRLCTQIAILGWGAWLALEGELTGGMMIAASIVASRALAPIEGTIEGWQQLRPGARRLRAHQGPPAELAAQLRPAAAAAARRPPDRRAHPLRAAAQQEGHPERHHASSSSPGEFARHRRRLRHRANRRSAACWSARSSPTAGSVRLDMMDLRNWDPRQFGESVGYLPQDVQLFPAIHQGQHRPHARGCHATRTSSTPPRWPTSTR